MGNTRKSPPTLRVESYIGFVWPDLIISTELRPMLCSGASIILTSQGWGDVLCLGERGGGDNGVMIVLVTRYGPDYSETILRQYPANSSQMSHTGQGQPCLTFTSHSNTFQWNIATSQIYQQD